MLPQDFLERMEKMLGQEYPAFLAGYEKEPKHSLRMNPLKGTDKTAYAWCPFLTGQVEWEPNGYYYENDAQPGKHPYHEAGLYYIQEASAMAPVRLLKAEPGERILDLCAAPGGKTTQIAADMQGQGLLVCNEIHPARAKILSENVERMGIANALVLNETPSRLAERFEEYFDRILVDAPCSGEGMFRKNESACQEWSLDNVTLCAARQDEILDMAAGMLRPGGRLVYSTCTFSEEENEGSIHRFVERHPEFLISETIRLWPHKVNGEGHFAAVLVKEGQTAPGYEGFCLYGEQKGKKEKECTEYLAFRQEFIKRELPGELLMFGDQLYLMPEGMPSIQKLKVLRAGLHLGTVKKNRFEPSHALALFLHRTEVKNCVNLDSSGPEIKAYLNGQTLPLEGEKGWYLVTVDGISIGWGKLAGGILKNHYPKGLRG